MRGIWLASEACSSVMEFELSTMKSTSRSPLARPQQLPVQAVPTKARLKCEVSVRAWPDSTRVGRATKVSPSPRVQKMDAVSASPAKGSRTSTGAAKVVPAGSKR